MRTPIAYFLMLSGILFTIGTVGVLVRKNALRDLHVGRAPAERREPVARRVLAACTTTSTGQVLAFFSMVVAAAEVVVGLAIIVAIFRRRRSVDVDDAGSCGGRG